MATAEKTHIKKLITHLDPDIDDLEAIRIMRRWGRHIYPGIENAKVEVTGGRAVLGKSLRELENAGIFCIGIGGSQFDEHPMDGRPARLDECAATLVASHLRVRNKRALQKNLEYALAKNYSANTHEFEIAPLAKLAFRHLSHKESAQEEYSSSLQKILEAVFFFMDTAEENEKSIIHGTPPKGAATMSMDTLIAAWLLESFDPDGKLNFSLCKKEAEEKKRPVARIIARHLGMSEDKTLARILEYARLHQTSDSGRIETNFELVALVELAQKHYCFGVTEMDMRLKILSHASIFLNAMWRKETNFHIACRNDWESPSTHHLFVPIKKDESLRITSVVSANPEIAKFCRSKDGGYAVAVIKQSPSGNVVIFFDKKRGLDISKVALQIRLSEREKNNKLGDEYTFEELMALGNNIKGAEVWYFDGHQLMNGSLTTDVEPTKLSREEIEKIVHEEIALQVRNRLNAENRS